MDAIKIDPHCEGCGHVREKPAACGGCQYWLEQEFEKLLKALAEISDYDYGLRGGYYGAYIAMRNIARDAIKDIAW